MSPECPSVDQLQAFANGDLSEDELDTIADHIESCTVCDDQVEMLQSKSDSILHSFRLAHRDYIGEAAFERARVRVEAIGRETMTGDYTAEPIAPESQPPDKVGQYEMLEKLGAGGMGTVYKALQPHLDRIVAIKLLPPERMENEAAVARFRREMKAVGKFTHPNIVAAYDAGEADGVQYLVMEYVDGVDLSACVKRNGPLPIADACEVLRQAAIGLQRAHEDGLIHRDIKPSNLMLTRDGQVKVLDMGLALLAEEHRPIDDEEITSSGQMMGTLDYMAPEQGSNSHDVDSRVDIYSMGATLYKLLAGRAPFDEPSYDTPVKRMMALGTKEPTPIRELREDVPEALGDLIHCILAKSPEDRPATAAEVAEALQPFTVDHDLTRLMERECGDAGEMDKSRAGTDEHLSSALLDTRSAIKPKPSGAPAVPKQRSRRPMVVALGMLAVALVAGVVLLSIRTSDGTITVEIDEKYRDDIDVLVTGDGNKVTISKKNGFTIQIARGKYGVKLGRGDDKFELDRDSVTVTNNGKAVVKVHLRKRVATAPKQKQETSKKVVQPTLPVQPQSKHLRGLLPSPREIPGIRRWQVVTTKAYTHDNNRPVRRLSPNGKWLVVGCEQSKYFYIHDIQNGRIVGVISQPMTNPPGHLSWNSHGDHLVCRTSAGLRIYRYDGKPEKVVSQQGSILATAWSFDGRWIATGTRDAGMYQKSICLWHADGQGLHKVIGQMGNEVDNLAFSPNGRWLAAGDNSGEIRVYRLDGDMEPIIIRQLVRNKKGELRNLEWSPDGKKLSAARERDYLFDIEGKNPTVGVAVEGMRRIVWSPDGSCFAGTITIDKIARRYAIRVGLRDGKDQVTGMLPADYAHNGWVSVAWSADGKKVIAASNRVAVAIFDWDGKRLTLNKQFAIPSMQRELNVGWQPDGSHVLVSMRKPPDQLRDLFAYFWKCDLSGKSKLVHQRKNGYLLPSPDGRWVAAASGRHAGSIDLLSSDGEKQAQTRLPFSIRPGHRNDRTNWADNSTHIAFWSNERGVIWNIAEGKAIVVKKSKESRPAVSPDGQWLVEVIDGKAQLRRADGSQTLQLKSEYKFSQSEFLGDGVFSPDGKYVATAGETKKDGKTISVMQLWNMDGSLAATFECSLPHWSPNGMRFLAGRKIHESDDGDVPFKLRTDADGGVFKIRDTHFYWSSKGDKIAAISGGDSHFDRLVLVDLRTRIKETPVATIPGRAHHAFWNQRLAYSPDSKLLAAGLTADGVVLITPEGKHLWQMVPFTDGASIVFSAGGDVLQAPKDVDRYVSWIVEEADGSLTTMTRAEFEDRVRTASKTAAKGFDFP